MPKHSSAYDGEFRYRRARQRFDDDVVAWRGVLQSAAVHEFHESDGVLIEATSTPPGMGSMVFPGYGAELLGWLDRAPRVATFGAFVEIAEGVEGLCHKSEAVDGNGQPLHLEPGIEHEFKIIKMSPEEKKVGLSIRAVGEEASRSEVEAYKQPVSSTSSTIGELISWKRASNENN